MCFMKAGNFRTSNTVNEKKPKVYWQDLNKGTSKNSVQLAGFEDSVM